MDIRSYALEYVAVCRKIDILEERLDRIGQTTPIEENNVGLPVGLVEAEHAINELVRRWRENLHELKLWRGRYELAASVLNKRERFVLKIHFEQGITLREMAQWDMSEYELDPISLSTLSRTCKRIVEKLSTEVEHISY